MTRFMMDRPGKRVGVDRPGHSTDPDRSVVIMSACIFGDTCIDLISLNLRMNKQQIFKVSENLAKLR